MIIKWYGKGEFDKEQFNLLSIPTNRITQGLIDTGEMAKQLIGEEWVFAPVKRRGLVIDFVDMPSEDNLIKIDALLVNFIRDGKSPIAKRIVDNLDVREDNPQKGAYKLSQLYGLTHEQLDTYIDNNMTDLASAKEIVRNALHVILWLVKQTKLDEL